MGKLLRLNISNDRADDVVIHNGEVIPVIKYKHMPRVIITPFLGEGWNELVFSFYKGVTVRWDEDMDTRVLILLDEMAPKDREGLLCVEETQGCVSFGWRDYIPDRYTKGGKMIKVDGDSWDITDSLSFADRRR